MRCRNARAGVAQIYVSAPGARVDRPRRELKAFRKEHLAPGESTTITFELDQRAFAHWSSTGWTTSSGEYVIEVGASSRDVIERATVHFEIPAASAPLRADSTLDEWNAHSVGRPVLQSLFDQFGGTPSELVDPQLRAMAGPMPLARIISIAAGIDGNAIVSNLLTEVEQRTPSPN